MKLNSTIVGRTTFKVYVGCGGAVCIVDEPKRALEIATHCHPWASAT